MSKIVNPTIYSVNHFVNNIYNAQKKQILFWDTCALLDIIRFLYRNNGNIATYRCLNSVNNLIQSDAIYSISSSLTIREWNDHEDKVKDEIRLSLQKTSVYHKNTIEVVNAINSTSYISESLHNKRLLETLEIFAKSVLDKTFFLGTEDIANKALIRVADKKAPASKKQEFKDCAVWETMLLVCEEIRNVSPMDYGSYNKVFYTVNTDDFIDKSREPKVFYPSLLSESSLKGFVCCKVIDEVYAAL